MFLLCLCGMNLLLFVLMGADKRAAIARRRRVPETTLLALAVLGGSLGGIAGMLLFRHKTRKAAFFLGYPAIALAQAAIAALAYYRGLP